MEEAIVLYPSPGIGHLVSMVELGRFILKHHPSFSVIILITNAPYNTGSTSPYINSVSITTPSIIFHQLPIIPLPPDATTSAHHEQLLFHVLNLNNNNVENALQAISHVHLIRALVIDFFCTPALYVASALNLPAYYFFTSAAACLASFLYLPTIHKTTPKSLKDLNSDLEIPGLPTKIPSSDMPKPFLDRADEAYGSFFNVAIHFPKSTGIIVNSFEELEPTAVKAIADGLCVPDAPTPPAYCIGPLIAANHDGGGAAECLRWLDSQPPRSVVFLCFGSYGTFSAEQLKAMAVGLERSDQRFLWVVRSPPLMDLSKHFLAPPEPDLDALLPEGFLGRTKDRGMVVKSWAPQVAVLSHDSVGGFVTHCGWNSVLEALTAGVPMVAWPLYAEQRLNRMLMVGEMGVALPVEEPRDGVVGAFEVEKRVKQLMDSVEGKAIRERVCSMRERARLAMTVGGSSLVAFAKLAESWKQG